MTDPASSSAVLTPPPAKTEFLGPGHTPEVLPRPDPSDFRIYLGPNRQLHSLGSLGHYEVLEIIGRGGFGIVLKAFDEKLQRFVAIKALDPALGNTSPVRKSFLREARSAAKVRHENVVQIYAVEEQPLPYLVMEYIDGDTLQHRLDSSGPLEASEIVTLGKQICEGLAAAHDQGLIHRDIKPANILIERGPTLKVKLTDFGLARTADDASLTRSGVVVGTPLYMAPEQASAEAIDHRADLFSLGSVFYAMASGRPPFRAPTSLAVMNRVVNETPRSIRHVIPDVPEGLCQLIGRLHEKSPDERIQSAREVAEKLSHCLTNPAIVVTPARNGKRLAAVALGMLAVFALAAFALRPSGTSPVPIPIAAVGEGEPAPPPPKPARVLNVWEKYVATLPAEEQVLEVCKQLKSKQLNFDMARVKHRISDDKVVMFEVDGTPISDLSPIRGFPALEELELMNNGVKDFEPLRGLPLRRLSSIHNPIGSLAPLEGMPLVELTVWSMGAASLAPLRGMKLELLNCGDSPVRDLGPLQGMQLRYLCINRSQVSDISVLKGMPLQTLMLEKTPCTDISPLAGLPIEVLYILNSKFTDHSVLRTLANLKEIKLDYAPERDRALLLALPNLRTINEEPANNILNQ